MINEHIFATIRDNIAGLETTSGSFNIYPLRVPDGLQFDLAIVYNKTTGTPVFHQTGTDVQLTVISKTYSQSEQTARELVELFRNKQYSVEGDVVATTVKSISELPQDIETKLYLTAVTIYIKTAKTGA